MGIRDVLEAGVSLTRLGFSMLGIWAELDWNVRRARKAFERELVKQGMTRSDARRLSAQFSKLKDQMMASLTSAAFRRH